MSLVSNLNTNLVWIDLEMTGLDLEKCKIVEIGCLITNKDLDIIAEGPDIVVHQSEEDLAVMDEVVIKMHSTSGLTTEIRNSQVTSDLAEEQVLNFVKQFSNPKMSPLCGNSVYIDRKFIAKYMSKLDQYLMHRNIDVSTIKELYKHWVPDPKEYKKAEAHRALDDIRESIEELKHYRDIGFIG